MCLLQGLQGEGELRGRVSSTGDTGGGGVEGPCVYRGYREGLCATGAAQGEVEGS